jgi:hypothetical protein
MPFIGTYLPYLEARDFARSSGIKSQTEWNKYSKKDRPHNIPSNPSKNYKNKGWNNWMEWLGTNNKIGAQRKYKVNNNFFKKWSLNMAYILGFWFADGCMRSTKKTKIFSISQHKKDKYLLEAILKEMDSDYPLSQNVDCCCCFTVCSEEIYNDIIKLGGKERKSLDVKFPHVPKKYLSDFVRGLWDGDGSIYYHTQSKSYASTYTSGSKDFIVGLYLALQKDIPNLRGGLYNGKLYNESRRDYCLHFSTNDTIRLKKFMYQEPMEGKLMLKRKYNLFLKTRDYCSHEFLDYPAAQKIVRLFNFKIRKEWWQHCKDDTIPHDIPHNPYSVYKNSGWVDWGTWLGTTKKAGGFA